MLQSSNEHNIEFIALQWAPQLPDLSPIEHLWDVVELEICILDVQQLHDVIMWIQAKISVESFQHLGESVPQRIKEVLKAKGGPT